MAMANMRECVECGMKHISCRRVTAIASSETEAQDHVVFVLSRGSEERDDRNDRDNVVQQQLGGVRGVKFPHAFDRASGALVGRLNDGMELR